MRTGLRLARGLVAVAALVATVLAAPVRAVAAPGPIGPEWTVGAHFAPELGVGLDVACPTSLDCYALSLTTSGLDTIRTTTDGGATWKTAQAETPGVVPDVLACSDATRCVAIDGSRSMLALWTDDGGATWRATKLPAAIAYVADATCVRSGRCVAVGIDAEDNPVLMETDDQGASWRVHAIDPAITSGQIANLSLVVACVNGRTCVVGQRGSAAGVVFRTIDGGRHWATVRLPGRFGELSAISCTRTAHCAVTGVDNAGTVATSGNGGATWRWALRTRSVLGYFDVACTLRGACLAAGVTARAELDVAATTDGVRWRSSHAGSGQLASPPSIACGAATCAVVAGLTTDAQRVEVTRDLGGTWTTEDAQHAAAAPESASCPSAGTCEIVGFDAAGALAERTTDDGATFTRQTLPAGVAQVSRVACATATACQAVGLALHPGREVLLGTSDGGATWTEEVTPPTVATFTGVACASSAMCVAVGLTKSFGVEVLATTDGGTTWTAGALHGLHEDLAEPTSVTCLSATTCIAGLIALPAPGFLRTTDGGATWTFVPSVKGDLLDGIAAIPVTVSCATQTACVAIGVSLFGGGLTVLVSNDGGVSWAVEHVLGADLVQASPLQCLPDGRCLVVAADELRAQAYLLTSTDSGATWSSSRMPAGWLVSVALSCPGDTSCFSVGIEADGGYAFATYG